MGTAIGNLSENLAITSATKKPTVAKKTSGGITSKPIAKHEKTDPTAKFQKKIETAPVAGAPRNPAVKYFLTPTREATAARVLSYSSPSFKALFLLNA